MSRNPKSSPDRRRSKGRIDADAQGGLPTSEPTGLPPGWTNIALGNLGLGRTEGVEPANEPTTLFELWSVPSFPTGKPERVLGSAVGSNKQRVAEGDVLLCKINPRINRVWVVGPSSGLPQIASTEWIVFRSEAFEPAFLMWRFRENRFRGVLCANMTGVGGSLTRARPKDVAEIKIALPSLAEQRRIVGRLEVLRARSGRARAHLEAIPAMLARARRSVLSAGCSGYLTRDWREDYDCRSWQTLRFGDLVISSFYGPRFGAEDYAKTGVPTVRITDMDYRGNIDVSQSPRVSLSASELDRLGLKDGDVVITRTGATIGKCAVYSETQGPAIPSAYLIRFRLDQTRIAPRFALLFLLSPDGQRQLNGGITAVAQPNVNAKAISAFELRLPPLSEQHEIVRRTNAALSRLEAAEEAQAQALAELDRLDQSLLARAFSGTLVPRDPADEPAAIALARREAPATTRPSYPTEAYFVQLVPALLRAVGRPFLFDQLNALVALLFIPEQLLPLVESVGGREARAHFADFAQSNQSGALLNALILLGKAGTLAHSEVDGCVMLHLNEAKLPPIHFAIATDARHLAAVAALVPAAVAKSSGANLQPQRLRESLSTVS